MNLAKLHRSPSVNPKGAHCRAEGPGQRKAGKKLRSDERLDPLAELAKHIYWCSGARLSRRWRLDAPACMQGVGTWWRLVTVGLVATS